MPRLNKPKRGAREMAAVRKVIHKDIRWRSGLGDDALTVQECKDLIGWCEDKDEAAKQGVTEPLFRDMNRKPIYCLNNVTNRPLYMSVVEDLIQEHLNVRWRYNGEAIIIGRTGLVLNGQHTLISVPLAEQIRTSSKQKVHWEENWPDAITMQKAVIYGIDESDETVNTMDTAKPRSLADVIYRSEFFKSEKAAARKAIARIADYAIRLLWYRTGACMDDFSARRTHSEAMAFINHHPRLLRCVKHIWEEDRERSLSGLLTPGYAAGLLFLMGAGATDEADYATCSPPGESVIDWEYYESATKFWVLLSANDPSVRAIRTKLSKMMENDGRPTRDEKLAVIVKGWMQFREDGKVTPGKLTIKYDTDEFGTRTLAENPICEGIDRGNPYFAAPEEGKKKKGNLAKAKEDGADEPEEDQEEQHPDEQFDGDDTGDFGADDELAADGDSDVDGDDEFGDNDGEGERDDEDSPSSEEGDQEDQEEPAKPTKKELLAKLRARREAKKERQLEEAEARMDQAERLGKQVDRDEGRRRARSRHTGG